MLPDLFSLINIWAKRIRTKRVAQQSKANRTEKGWNDGELSREPTRIYAQSVLMSHPGGRKRVQMSIRRAPRPRWPRPSSAFPSRCCLKMASWESCEAQTIDDRNKPRTSDKTKRFTAPQDSWDGALWISWVKSTFGEDKTKPLTNYPTCFQGLDDFIMSDGTTASARPSVIFKDQKHAGNSKSSKWAKTKRLEQSYLVRLQPKYDTWCNSRRENPWCEIKNAFATVFLWEGNHTHVNTVLLTVSPCCRLLRSVDRLSWQ